jgi:hypothetical protein
MRYIVFTFDGYGLPIGLQLQREGAEVLVAQVQDQEDVLSELELNIPTESDEARTRRLSLYDGLLEKRSARLVCEELLAGPAQPDTFLFFDLNHLFKFSEKLQVLGYPGNYPTAEDYRLEIDRESAKKFVARHYPNVRVGENHKFKSVDQGVAFLATSDDLWVLKGLEEDARTVVPDVDDAKLAQHQIEVALTHNREEYESAGFVLEKYIPASLEFTPQTLFWNGQHVCTLMVLENKAMGAGNVGPLTDCAQDVTFVTAPSDRINDLAFPPKVAKMAAHHRGAFFWDASLLIAKRSGKMYFGEFCANRPGYNAIYNQISLAGSATKYFESLATGKCPFPDNSVGVAVRMFNFHSGASGYPQSELPVEFKAGCEKDLWLTDVRKGPGSLVNVGLKTTIGVATGSGHSLRDAARRAHKVIDKFSFEGIYYRPQFDLVSRRYPTSIVNRIEYGLHRGFYKIGFGIA